MQNLILFLKGMAMGAANVIPGISGGTMAFITGIYGRLVSALKNIDLAAGKLLFAGKWKAFAWQIDLKFLFFLFLGVGISILSVAKTLTWAFDEHEVLTLAFFFGLILSSILGVGRQIGEVTPSVIVSFFIGCSMVVGIAFLPPVETNSSMFYVFLCGMVAVCSMMLPGLSGAYLLLLMGNYTLVLTAVSSFNFNILLPLMIGITLGLVLFSRLINWLFDHFKSVTIALLTGFTAGSLLIIWPWKNRVYTIKDAHSKTTEEYEWFFPELNVQFLLALSLFILGFLMVWFIDRKGGSATK